MTPALYLGLGSGLFIAAAQAVSMGEVAVAVFAFLAGCALVAGAARRLMAGKS